MQRACCLIVPLIKESPRVDRPLDASAIMYVRSHGCIRVSSKPSYTLQTWCIPGDKIQVLTYDKVRHTIRELQQDARGPTRALIVDGGRGQTTGDNASGPRLPHLIMARSNAYVQSGPEVSTAGLEQIRAVQKCWQCSVINVPFEEAL